MNIIELRRALDAKRKEMKTMLESAQENRSVDFQTKFDVLKAEAESLKFSLNELEQLEAEEQRTLETHSGSETRKFEMPTETELRSLLLHDEISKRSMDTSNTGDVMIPEVQRTIMKTLTDDSPIRQLADHKTTSVQTYQIPVQINGATVAEAAENDARGETGTPTLKMANATLTETYAQPKVSQQLLDMNSGFDIIGFVSGAVSDAYSEHENQKFADVLNDATLTNGAFTFGTIRSVTITSLSDVDEIRKFTKTLKQTYRKKASFLVSEDVLTAWEELKDADNKPLVGSVENGGSKTFLGYPVSVCEELNTGSLYFGNFKRAMAVVDHTGSMGAIIDRVTEKGQVKYYSYIYSAAMLVDHKAMAKAVTA
ncbi:phage major capsid protein [Vibrio cholerae]|uniref:phage major capsid protein n=1 Tax=Vibrio cholerae TaxID=666 RepID=UPI0004E2B87C|nr:phage major capsid protein [Vibrio cholerae]EGQ9389480.1 phage major capsid protein [Vibrio cholerae]EGR0537584.1 phage major capsid protein [Vibrio cholerae]EGR2309612.1 phage major capsid protein [Vibrio cholerae]EGR3953510.1 phage major capsid protein [Vibrio cholerae]EGR3989108.1 phage major capsid protein [Vibrio cholerae]